MIYKRKAFYIFLTLACILHHISNAQLQLSDPDEQFLLETIKPPYTVKSIQLASGIHLQYAEQGPSSGIPVIFLHGYTDSWHSFHQVLPWLPASIHAYALSQRGHGNSDRPESNYTPQDFASDLAAFMQQLKIESAIIVGHSMGATVVQRFALDYPQKIKALVLVASFASTGNTGIGELNSIVSRMEDPVDIGFVYEFQKSTAFKSVPSASMEIYVNESMKVPARVWKAVAQQAMNVDYLSELKGIDIPTLIVWGDKDLFCPKKDQEALAATFKGSVWLTYEGTGHAIHWEDPVRFAKDLIDFIYQTEENRVILCGIGLLDNYSATSFY